MNFCFIDYRVEVGSLQQHSVNINKIAVHESMHEAVTVFIFPQSFNKTPLLESTKAGLRGGT